MLTNRFPKLNEWKDFGRFSLAVLILVLPPILLVWNEIYWAVLHPSMQATTWYGNIALIIAMIETVALFFVGVAIGIIILAVIVMWIIKGIGFMYRWAWEQIQSF